MKHTSLSIIAFLFVVFMGGAASSLAGTGRVNFGTYVAGQGCSGTGLCQIGSTGATVTFYYYQNPDTAGGSFTRLTMMVNYDQAVANGFIGSNQGGAYIFTGSYTFDHPDDQGTGVPSSYSIPAGYICNYGPKDTNGRITLTISQFTKS